MKPKEFKKYMRVCKARNGAIDISGIKSLSIEVKRNMARYIVRQRLPLLLELWLSLDDSEMDRIFSCGYLYATKGLESGNIFVHTCEHINIR